MHLFDKLDGANLRFEWSRERGWFRWGSRHQVIDETPPIFGPGMALFREHHADGIERVARAQRWQAVVVMAKAKTEAWVRRILERYGEAEGRALVDS